MSVAREIITALGGRWHGSYGLAPCVCHADGASSALKVSDAPARSGGVDVHCFAGCDWRAVKAALRRRGLIDDEAGNSGTRTMAAPTFRSLGIEAERKERGAATARRIWRAALKAEGTLTADYLRGRKIESIPPSIRHQRSLRHSPTGLYLPAMVACVQFLDGQFAGIHRTFLAATGTGKAPVAEPKMMLGSCAGGAVRFARATDELAVGEGIETCLSFQQETGMPTWAALSTSGLRSVALPPLPLAATVYIVADNDDAGEKAAQSAARRWYGQGRAVRIVRPVRAKDLNDLVREAAHD